MDGTTPVHGTVNRARIVGLLILALFGCLLVRYFHLMVLSHDEWTEVARRQFLKQEDVPAFRGAIVDRRGRELALTQSFPSVAVDPSRIPPEGRDRVARDLAQILGLPFADVRRELEGGSNFRYIRRVVRDRGAVLRIGEIGYRDGILVVDELARSYPHGAAAAHLLGFVGVDGKGLSGLELACEKTLAAKPGQRVVLRDGWSSRRISATPPELTRPGVNGQDVVLALDAAVQSFAEAALDRAVAEWTPESAAAIVMDPRNGDVLAMAVRPGFDPARRTEVTTDRARIRAISDAWPVGSVMKPLIVAGALDAGAISVHETFDCTTNGAWRYKGRLLHEHDGRGIGVAGIDGILIRSSNIGAAQIGLKLGMDRTYALLHSLGFGRPTGCGLPGESHGMLADRADWREQWTLPSVCIGQEITATPLQFATAFAALANGGTVYRPRIVLSEGGREIPVEARSQVFPPDVCRNVVVPILVRAVDEAKGRPAAIEGYAVAGKTGTAQHLTKRQGVTGYTSSFVGFAPAEDPRFLVYVVLNRPTRAKGTPYGSRCAAPAAREILAGCLKYAEIPPSRPAAETARGF